MERISIKKNGKTYMMDLDQDIPAAAKAYALDSLKKQADGEEKWSSKEKFMASVELLDENPACPFCLTKEKTQSSRKETVYQGFFSGDELIDIFTCSGCKREFTSKELQNKIRSIKDENECRVEQQALLWNACHNS